VDVIIGPTTPTVAFKLGAKVDDPITMYLSISTRSRANLAGLPGLSMPVRFRRRHAGGPAADRPRTSPRRAYARTAHRYQQDTDWHLRAPAAFA
jgi:aspartyl-tRNA(Asn)/glutamyl-tRNA(Gln) amidotransferase subunit A